MNAGPLVTKSSWKKRKNFWEHDAMFPPYVSFYMVKLARTILFGNPSSTCVHF